ncbi:hypothetical protein PGTUg99_010300 [Puccinia graminis f. sp. tritici]|uniref:Uncharacterized protein n=1 Tax=Puccinia graminis f. sp. tritici TaxID=56615 RepID=A0A5B0QKZ3_PUCGR|nr:hypothetical protein PGTUg99_010526 [Puccinia graminis f. sp. tritici]KAA1135189.1 hypothetical protein PGTUg99_010300 [Puccinia graminis f. sp. tritici]
MRVGTHYASTNSSAYSTDPDFDRPGGGNDGSLLVIGVVHRGGVLDNLWSCWISANTFYTKGVAQQAVVVESSDGCDSKPAAGRNVCAQLLQYLSDTVFYPDSM